jgi:hypothetical protein
LLHQMRRLAPAPPIPHNQRTTLPCTPCTISTNPFQKWSNPPPSSMNVTAESTLEPWSSNLAFTHNAQSQNPCSATPFLVTLSHATKMQLFWSQLKANHVLPHVLIFDYFKYYYYYFEII